MNRAEVCEAGSKPLRAHLRCSGTPACRVEGDTPTIEPTPKVEIAVGRESYGGEAIPAADNHGEQQETAPHPHCREWSDEPR